MHTNRWARAATIFSAGQRSAAAFDHIALAINLIGAVDVHAQALNRIRIEHRNAQSQQALGVATELETAPLISPFMLARASMNLFTVEPVPTPTISPGRTYCKAAWPTRVFSSS